jgi:hypothetical protein
LRFSFNTRAALIRDVVDEYLEERRTAKPIAMTLLVWRRDESAIDQRYGTPWFAAYRNPTWSHACRTAPCQHLALPRIVGKKGPKSITGIGSYTVSVSRTALKRGSTSDPRLVR